MSIFKCKMCGGTIEFEQGATVGVCDSCGTKQTLPRLDDDRRANLYDRANHFRRNNEFDKAAAIYEQILTEDTTDAEAYWSLVLCQYGIEYVEDPATHKRVPTVNRAQFTSIFDDDNYRSAIQYADGLQSELYEKEAAEINEIQKGILAISQKEEPFDVFICYKETDANGRRTPDSVLANDLYHQLTQEGFKIFFSRITLEDKLGTAYEPYIFAALNSAKVMVVLGTKPEHFNAVWVKNEWSRYLALVKQSGGKKILIPAYKDMDPYDLPEEFSHLQAQDMSKLGFMQDLIRGIKKIVSVDGQKAAVKETVVVNAGAANVAPFLERVFLFLEDGKWQDANIYCEKVLDIDPKNAEAYLGKLMAELKINKLESLADCQQPFDGNNNYQKAVRFGDEKLASTLKGYIAHINERNEIRRLSDRYNEAVRTMNKAEHSNDTKIEAYNAAGEYKAAAAIFEKIPGFKDSDILAKQCLDKAEACRKNAIYNDAIFRMKGEDIYDYESAIKKFQLIPGWKDADDKINVCRELIEKITAKNKKQERIRIIVILSVLAAIVISILLLTVFIPSIKRNSKYNSALELYNSGEYEKAVTVFKELDGYKDSEAKAEEVYVQFKIEKLKKAGVGDYVLWGHYEQDNDISNGEEEIEWLVLAKEADKTLVISRYALDCQQYNTSYTEVTWDTCSLRKWLNGTFIDSAFGTEEQDLIQSTTVTADNNPSYSTSPGNSTIDRVFLLSLTEVNDFCNSDDVKRCAPTEYAINHGLYTDTNGDNCSWWLRSPGSDSKHAAIVRRTNKIEIYGIMVNSKCAIRPALWIKVENTNIENVVTATDDSQADNQTTGSGLLINDVIFDDIGLTLAEMEMKYGTAEKAYSMGGSEAYTFQANMTNGIYYLFDLYENDPDKKILNGLISFAGIIFDSIDGRSYYEIANIEMVTNFYYQQTGCGFNYTDKNGRRYKVWSNDTGSETETANINEDLILTFYKE